MARPVPLLDDQIRANQRRTVVLFVLLFLVFVLFALGVGGIVAFTVRRLDAILFGLILVPVVFLPYALITTRRAVPTIVKAGRARKPNLQVRSERLFVNAVEEMAIAAGLPTPRAYVQDDPDVNAFAAGTRPEEAILCVTTGALSALNQEQLQGVIGHEMAHIENHDIRVTTIAVAVVGFMGVVFDLSWHLMRGRGKRPVQLLLLVALAGFAYLLSRLTYFALSRRREYLADESGAQLTRNPEGLAQALQVIESRQPTADRGDRTVAALYLDNPFRRGVHDSVWSSHPPLPERVRRLGGPYPMATRPVQDGSQQEVAAPGS